MGNKGVDKMNHVLKAVYPMIEDKVQSCAFELVDVEYVKEGKQWFLRIFIDKPGGIDIEECVLASEKISEALDQLDPDPIPHAYFLEVSSPGAERPLKTEEDLKKAIQEYIHVSLYQQIEGQKQWEGTLIDLNDEELVLDISNHKQQKTMSIPRTSIAKVRKAIKF